MEWNEWIAQAAIAAVSAGAGAYGAVRAELAKLNVRVEAALSEARRANDRIDGWRR